MKKILLILALAIIGIATLDARIDADADAADFSVAKPTIPAVGADFAASGPFASYTLAATVPANAGRVNIAIENNSAGRCAIVIDDGATASGKNIPLALSSVFALEAGGAGQQGGNWTSSREKGRVQVYVPSGTAATAQIFIREN